VILLWGALDDEPMAMTFEALLRANAEFVFLDHRKIFTSEIEYAFESSGVSRCFVRADELSIDMTEVEVVYERGSDFYDYEELDGKPPDDPLALRAMRFETELRAWLDASDALVINRSGPSATNNSKPLQLAVIREAGFAIPETLITNQPEAAREFLAAGECVYKSVSGVRSIAQPAGESQRGILEDVRWCPTLFQRLVEGTNFRAHVIGNDVLAVRIESDRLDYRYGKTSMLATSLPKSVAERCRRLTATLGLHFSGIDLMQATDGTWYCFEVNPSPGYPYFEMLSGQAISAALARFIIDASG
jgi:glutathione synthase/RimK-type ligase-like ATP-grasp enzyme